MSEKKINSKTLQESIKIHNVIKDEVETVPAEDCLGAIETFDKTQKTCIECKERIQVYYDNNYEQMSVFTDETGAPSTNCQIVQSQSQGYKIHPRKLLKFVRDHSVITCSSNDIIIVIEPGYEYLLDILTVNIQLDHDKIAAQHVAGALHPDLNKFIIDIPSQLSVGIGVAHVKKGGNNSGNS